MITKDTSLYLSLSQFPGNGGTLLFNRLFALHGMDAIYKACAVKPGQFENAIAGVCALGVKGAAVSMPFKSEAASLVDSLDPIAQRIGAINTIVRQSDDSLKGFNTDYLAAKALLKPHTHLATFLLGAGGGAAAIALALNELGFKKVTIVARDGEKAESLAKTVGFQAKAWTDAESDSEVELLINASPLGMKGHDSLLVPAAWQENLKEVLDLPIGEGAERLRAELNKRNVGYVGGLEFGQWQAVEQFFLYSQIRLSVPDIQALQK